MLLHDDDSDVRAAAAYVVGEIGGPDDASALVALVSDPERNAFMPSKEAILALGVLGKSDSIKELVERKLSNDLLLEAVLALRQLLPDAVARDVLRSVETNSRVRRAVRAVARDALREGRD